MSQFRPIDRRHVLRGAGGIVVGLPWLEAMVARKAQAAVKSPRVVFFNTMNGTIKPKWTPTGTETAFTLSPILAPLEPHKSKVLILEGVDNVAATKGGGDDHMRGMGSMLTGSNNTAAPSGGGISLDQHLAREIGKDTRIPAIHSGVGVSLFGSVLCYTSYTGAGQPVPAENDPKKIFDRVFANFTPSSPGASGPDPALVTERANRKSVLDAVNESYKDLKGRVGRADAAKLDQHLTQIGELQTRLLADLPVIAAGASCTKPAAPSSSGDTQAKAKAHMDMIAMALACSITRVANLQWDTSAGNSIRYNWLNITRGHHEISHDADSSTTSQEQLTQINTWLTTQFAYLLKSLDAIPEGDGTVLDNTIVLWSNELTKGNVHSHPDAPLVLAGGKNLGLRTGRFLRYGNEPHNKVLVSIMNMAGVAGNSFGNGAANSGPLTGLV